MNNKGFVFIETIIVTVVLTTTLIFLYSNFSKNLNNEKKRLYYDDIAYVYKTIYIRDALLKSVDETIFNMAINDDNISNGNSLKNNFVYLFNNESKFCVNYKDINNSLECNSSTDYKSIFKDNTLLKDLNDLYNYKMLIYIKTADISNIKKCINGTIDASLQTKCNNYKLFTSKYSDSNLDEFMQTLDSEDTNSNSILIALYYEKKDGSKLDTLVRGGYNACLKTYIEDDFKNNATYCPKCVNESISDYSTLKSLYDKQDKISYNMKCENAYYLSWVYYD
ncbi:MAG: hypothetical protein ACI4XR_05580 [Bacilli bacterium]